MDTTQRRLPARSRAARRARRAATLPAVALLLALGACGTEDSVPVADDPAPESSTDDLTAQGGELCPAELPAPTEAEAAAYGEPATSAPQLPTATEAWVCRYDPGTGAGEGWQRSGGPEPVDQDLRADLDRDLAALEPAERDRACTQELGPRWLLVTAAGEDLTGVVVDDFGCREVRVSGLPGERVAGLDEGEGLVTGVLQGPATLVESLREVGSAFDAAPGDGGAMSPERWDAMVERLDCEGMPSIFMSDTLPPDAATSLRDAVETWARPGAEVRIDSRTGDRAEASVVVDGEPVVVLALVRHENGGWFVEGGAEC